MLAKTKHIPHILGERIATIFAELIEIDFKRGIGKTLTEEQMKLSLILRGFDLGRKYQVCLKRNPAHHISRGKDLDR